MRRPILPPAPSSAIVVINHLVVSGAINLTLANPSKAVLRAHLTSFEYQLQAVQRRLVGMSAAKRRATNQRTCHGESFDAESPPDITGSVSSCYHNPAHP